MDGPRRQLNAATLMVFARQPQVAMLTDRLRLGPARVRVNEAALSPS